MKKERKNCCKDLQQSPHCSASIQTKLQITALKSCFLHEICNLVGLSSINKSAGSTVGAYSWTKTSESAPVRPEREDELQFETVEYKPTTINLFIRMKFVCRSSLNKLAGSTVENNPRRIRKLDGSRH